MSRSHFPAQFSRSFPARLRICTLLSISAIGRLSRAGPFVRIFKDYLRIQDLISIVVCSNFDTSLPVMKSSFLIANDPVPEIEDTPIFQFFKSARGGKKRLKVEIFKLKVKICNCNLKVET